MGRLSCSFALNVSACFDFRISSFVKNTSHSAHSRSNSDKASLCGVGVNIKNSSFSYKTYILFFFAYFFLFSKEKSMVPMGRLSCSFALNVSACFDFRISSFVKNTPHSAHSRSNSDKASLCGVLISNTNISAYSTNADGETRTPDPRITNALLYQLSHIGIIKV